MCSSDLVGLDVDEVLKGLVTSAGGDVNVARFGIGTVDEIDKVRSSGWEHGSKDVNGASVQAGLLRLVEGAQCVCGGRRSTDDYAVRFNTVGTMFVLCGAFVGLDKLLASRAGCAIGFGSDVSESKQARYVRDALIDYGMLDQLINRTTGVIVVPEPSRKDLEEILTRSVIPSNNRLLAAMGVQIEVTGEAIRLMASHAHETQMYARGLKALASRLVEDIVYNETKGTVKLVASDVRAVIQAAP